MSMWTWCMRCEFYKLVELFLAGWLQRGTLMVSLKLNFCNFNNFTCVCLERMETRLMFTLYIHVLHCMLKYLSIFNNLKNVIFK